MQISQIDLQKIVDLVRNTAKYAVISEEFVRAIVLSEIQKGKTVREVVKSTRNKLHQVGYAYQQNKIPYESWQKELENLPQDFRSDKNLQFITNCLKYHSSTSERLPFLASFFRQTLAPIGLVESILDLACGFTPLCLPWMPVTENVRYTGIDIYEDLIRFLGQFFTHSQIEHKFSVGNILEIIPRDKVQLALLLKTIPCLEQVSKQAGRRILESIKAENILVSFPSRSLGGRLKGMAENYENHFYELISGKHWHITKTEFPNEITFLIQK
jgi:16S rRNA (guanine(1405)-N(7))-methyltransferase